jgi:hypothetical protein
MPLDSHELTTLIKKIGTNCPLAMEPNGYSKQTRDVMSLLPAARSVEHAPVASFPSAPRN